jgi:heme exporter protein A
MSPVSLKAEGIQKVFNRRKIFSGISFAVKESDAMSITGRNGSGKSTLVKIIAGVLAPTSGALTVAVGEKVVSAADRHRYIGFVSPYLQLYDEFTGVENLELFCQIRGIDADIHGLLEKVNLHARKNDLLRTYSSGMRQRLKYAFALIHRPPVLLLDEPTSNLDSEGKATVHRIVEEQRSNGIVIIATNDEEDRALCNHEIHLEA